MRAAILSCLLLFGFAAPTLACINDREVERDEQEFRSRYKADAPDAEPDVVASAAGPAQVALGGLLLVGGIGLAFRRKV